MKTSIIIAAYNAEKYIEKCLRSVKAGLTASRELIVVDDGSTDRTAHIAGKYATKLITNPQNFGRSRARNEGMRQAGGDILVFIDSDIIIRRNTLPMIEKYFTDHSDVAALTGMLSKEHPHSGFFSQYKNLYMHYIFRNLPREINFLYGSIHAMRRDGEYSFDEKRHYGEDTALGQKIYSQKGRVVFLRELEVEHLKEYSFSSFAKNDFLVPFSWAGIFIHFKGWKQLGYNGTGFAHASKRQLASIVLAPLILLPTVFAGSPRLMVPCFAAGVTAWGLLNTGFFLFLEEAKGPRYAILSVAVTFLDHLIMASGVTAGFISFFFRRFTKRRSR